MQLRWSPTSWHMGDPPDQTAPSSGLSPALATERISLHDSTFQGRLVMVDVLTGHGDTIVIQQAKCVKIWGREGRLGHVEVVLQMCSFVTSIFERPRLFLCLQHARIRKLIYTQNSEEPLNYEGSPSDLVQRTRHGRLLLNFQPGIRYCIAALSSRDPKPYLVYKACASCKRSRSRVTPSPGVSGTAICPSLIWKGF